MERPVAKLQLKSGREKPVNNRHPWIFSGSIATLSRSEPNPGDIVDVVDHADEWLARAYYNPNSQIRARILSWDPDEAIDEEFWRRRLRIAIGFRDLIKLEPATTAFRLVNAESDGIPGLIVDKYGEFLVFQALTAGIDSRKDMIISILDDLLSPAGIVERSDVPIRKKEGLQSISGLRAGRSPSEAIVVKENDHRFEVNLYRGHKTGLYLDQRENRFAVCRRELVSGRTVLNLFSYTGGFAIYAAGALAKRITNVDTSAAALEIARKNITLNGWDRPSDEYIVGDSFQILRHFRDEGREFDMIILDPPKFAGNKSDVSAAARGYKDINLLALHLLSENGWLATFSCSGLIQRDLFQKILFGAAVDAGRNVQIIKTLSQASDHPILISFPESQYLKGFLCRVF
jgi:23S rRNA (cytosine1962-C5)-methyltransferase